jgi:cytochrome c
MTRRLLGASLLVASAAPAFADGHLIGDAATGEAEFKKCKSCHMIVAPDGTEIYKGGKTGPNLWGVIGRPVGAQEGFGYSSLLKAGNAKGLVWDQAGLAAFIQDPSGYMGEATGDGGRSKMSFKLKNKTEDVAAYLASVAPAPAASGN